MLFLEGKGLVTKTLQKTLNVLGNLLLIILLICASTLVFFVIKGKLDGSTPTVAGNKVFIVLSGSMAPVFDAGSVVAIRESAAEKIAVEDIITFKDPEDASRIITHRVAGIKNENGALSFITKGDANNIADATPVPAENVLGKVTFWLPYLGYVLDFTKSKKGLVILLIVPGVLFIINEVGNLYKYVDTYEKEQHRIKAENEKSS